MPVSWLRTEARTVMGVIRTEAARMGSTTISALTDIAEIAYTEAPTAISRQDGDYLVTVTGTPHMGSNVSQLTAKVLSPDPGGRSCSPKSR